MLIVGGEDVREEISARERAKAGLGEHLQEIRAGKFKTDQHKFEYIKAMNSIMNKSKKGWGTKTVSHTYKRKSPCHCARSTSEDRRWRPGMVDALESRGWRIE